jgi:hypothetical protein
LSPTSTFYQSSRRVDSTDHAWKNTNENKYLVLEHERKSSHKQTRSSVVLGSHASCEMLDLEDIVRAIFSKPLESKEQILILITI